MDNNLISIKFFNYSCVLGISDPGKATDMVVRLSVFAFGAGRQSEQREEALTQLSQPTTLYSSHLIIKDHISLMVEILFFSNLL